MGGGYIDEMQNKAMFNQLGLKLPAGEKAGALLSFAAAVGKINPYLVFEKMNFDKKHFKRSFMIRGQEVEVIGSGRSYYLEKLVGSKVLRHRSAEMSVFDK